MEIVKRTNGTYKVVIRASELEEFLPDEILEYLSLEQVKGEINIEQFFNEEKVIEFLDVPYAEEEHEEQEDSPPFFTKDGGPD